MKALNPNSLDEQEVESTNFALENLQYSLVSVSKQKNILLPV